MSHVLISVENIEHFQINHTQFSFYTKELFVEWKGSTDAKPSMLIHF